MNTKKVIGMLLLVVLCAVCFPGNAQQVVPLTFNVFVAVQCPDETTKILIESYIKRELLGLRDVIVDLQNATWTHAIWINVIEPERLGIGKTGVVVINATYTEFIHPITDITVILEDHLPINTSVAIVSDLVDKHWFTTVHAYRRDFLTVGDRNNMEPLCKDIVAAFDGTALQITRKRR